VLDETGTLEYGQLFVQFTDPTGNGDGGQRRIISGTVLLGKMPALHSGDLRVLKCINHDNLRHYNNVVVFPQKGRRPHPNVSRYLLIKIDY
jgi:RNA-dependent RNA polymerase